MVISSLPKPWQRGSKYFLNLLESIFPDEESKNWRLPLKGLLAHPEKDPLEMSKEL
jgi:hypothetical protein